MSESQKVEQNWATPSAGQWFGFLLCGILGSLGHYCLTRSFHAAEALAGTFGIIGSESRDE